MRILHVIPSMSPSQGGPSVALPAMAKAVAVHKAQVDVVTTDDDGPNKRLRVEARNVVKHDGCRIIYFPKQTEFYKVSLPLLFWLIRHIRNYDVVQVHAVFSFASLAAGWLARLFGVRYIMHPLGVLGSWGMGNRRRWIKSLSFRLLDRPILDAAAAIYYTSQHEADDAARLQLRAPAVVIPLGIDLASYASVKTKAAAKNGGECTVLFMSRIDAKKGIDLLFKAAAKVVSEYPSLKVVIAGNGEADYIHELKMLAESLGIASHVTWPGFLGLNEKLEAFEEATVFVLPSYSESFGLALLEAMAAGMPCISTDQVALAVEVAPLKAVEMVKCDADELSASLRKLIADADLRREMGNRARQVACEQYSLESMGASLLKLYRGEGNNV